MYRLGHASAHAALRYQHATRERDTAIADAMGVLMRAAQSDRTEADDRPAEAQNRPAGTQEARPLGHAKVRPAVRTRSRNRPQGPDQGFRVERATRIEPAFSAWEIGKGRWADLRLWAKGWSTAVCVNR